MLLGCMLNGACALLPLLFGTFWLSVGGGFRPGWALRLSSLRALICILGAMHTSRYATIAPQFRWRAVKESHALPGGLTAIIWAL